jgi:hypothetical protein
MCAREFKMLGFEISSDFFKLCLAKPICSKFTNKAGLLYSGEKLVISTNGAGMIGQYAKICVKYFEVPFST